jgi:uncharacterized membrane protein
MKIVRVLCLLLVSLLAISPLGTVLAQEESLTVTTTNLPAGMVGEAYSATLEATGGAAPYTWSVSADSLPAGLSLNPATGKISGTPTEEGTANFTVKVTDSANPAQEATERLSIRINPISSVDIKATYPAVEGIAGANFEFEVELKYEGELGGEACSFDLLLTTPQGWSAYITPPYQKENRIREITLEPGFAAGTKLKVTATSPFWPLPEPGEYKITLEAISGEIKGATELTAVITAMYSMTVVPANELYNTTAKAGKDNFFSIEVGNLGTAAIDNIKFSSTKPKGWNIEFSPDKIESLSAFDSQTLDVNIKPPTETIAGDYQITVRVSGEQASEKIDIRVTVETPTIWGWVGVGIILVVIAGLAYIFVRFSRR